jgi:hypothetical protein
MRQFRVRDLQLGFDAALSVIRRGDFIEVWSILSMATRKRRQRCSSRPNSQRMSVPAWAPYSPCLGSRIRGRNAELLVIADKIQLKSAPTRDQGDVASAPRAGFVEPSSPLPQVFPSRQDADPK